jgi:phosphomannomutase
MITAGNHPPHFSGIAFKVSDGGPFKAEETQRIASHITADAGTYTPVAEYIVRADFIPPYLARVRTLIDFSRLRAFGEDPRNHAALIIDSMGGAGQTLIEDLLAPCGWRAQTIFGAADENFYDRTPKAVSEFLEPLNYNVRVTDTLFGVATDGDADRCGIVYDDGQWMDAKDAILALAWHLCEHKKWQGGIVAPPPVAETLLPLAEHWGVPVIEAAAGYNHVIEVMRASQCMVGGDGSGGFGYARHMPARDGILTALLFAEMIAMSGLSLRAIVDALHARAFL